MQLLHILHRLAGNGPAFQPEQHAHAGEHGRIDAVVLGFLSNGLGEAPRPLGVDLDHGVSGGVSGGSEACFQIAVVAAGGLEHDPAGCLAEPAREGPDPGVGVLETGRLLFGQAMHVRMVRWSLAMSMPMVVV